ncbi:hypothetical protein CCACVL1_23053 [Corchorus capsularis]|uniref:Uncharacterized protein n=1 Tax=Corchorus capsularis TaxID=210143 RepID=A0A1R3GVE1_COCAP|nr:hypothetical protein CCACVL1_23053 [Corchorus capsularis]
MAKKKANVDGENTSLPPESTNNALPPENTVADNQRNDAQDPKPPPTAEEFYELHTNRPTPTKGSTT